jgi:hypothetical protein
MLGSIFTLPAALGSVALGCGHDDTTVPAGAAAGPKAGDASASDVAPGAAEDGGSDAAPGQGPTLDAAADGASLPVPTADPSQFPAQAVTMLCERFRECCGAAPATWDEGRCERTNGGGGGFKNLGAHVAGLTGSAAANVTYDKARAATCLAEIASFTCPPTAQTAAEYQRARDDCYAALAGTIPLGGRGCTDDIHCAAGRCAGGTCSPLVAQGGACTKTDDCAYRGTSTPNLFCDDTAAGGARCAPRLDVGAACIDYADYDYAACTSGLCDLGANACTAAAPFVDPGTCTFFSSDAGN